MSQEIFRRLRKSRSQNQEWNDREILEQEHTDDCAPVLGVELEALGQQLGQDGGRRHGQRSPSTRPARHPNPPKRVIVKTSNVVATTCAAPRPKTALRMVTS